ncbi:uncharacterized protein LOC109546359 isoform X2 [Dendroctonus ponderosae]|uniref:uncharacterized protein LOC109546359 isoform X2 n=1 Tax=Dendroctonus ponderosae TaxID=77166 RepID=UPI002034C046|nr:uncharacterized protein LOC109546359 isoform X2 [Dendroctonus ponderosae]
MGIEPPGSYYLIKMVRRKELFRTTLVALVCLLLIALYQKNPSPLIRSRPATFQAIQIEDDQPLEEHSLKEVIINAQRSRLRKELYDFKFPSNRPLANFAMEDGGQPIRTIIFSTWRSGSTFLGDVLNALPGNYYHYEPLMDYGIIQIRGPPDADSALTRLKSLLNCDYTNLYKKSNLGSSTTPGYFTIVDGTTLSSSVLSTGGRMLPLAGRNSVSICPALYSTAAPPAHIFSSSQTNRNIISIFLADSALSSTT